MYLCIVRCLLVNVSIASSQFSYQCTDIKLDVVFIDYLTLVRLVVD
jgi:hypothetical protein